MRKEEFERKLDELAEWEIPKPVTSSTIRTNADHVESVTVYDELLDEEVEIEISMSSNATLPINLLKVKPQTKPCDSCGRLVDNRVVSIRRMEYPVKHWRESCNVCRKTKNPETGKFDLIGYHVNNYFVQYYRR